MRKWLEANLPAKKAVLGFSYCGWAWKLEDPKASGYDAATDGAAITPDGSVTYDEIKDYIVTSGAATYHDPAVVGFYCHAGTTWIGYDDNQSIVSKVKYAKQNGLHGYFSWHLAADYNGGLSRAGSSFILVFFLIIILFVSYTRLNLNMSTCGKYVYCKD